MLAQIDSLLLDLNQPSASCRHDGHDKLPTAQSQSVYLVPVYSVPATPSLSVPVYSEPTVPSLSHPVYSVPTTPALSVPVYSEPTVPSLSVPVYSVPTTPGLSVPVYSEPTTPSLSHPVYSVPTTPGLSVPVYSVPTTPGLSLPVYSEPTTPSLSQPVYSVPTTPGLSVPVDSEPTTPGRSVPVDSEPTMPSQPVVCDSQSIDTGEDCQKSRRRRNETLWKRNIRKYLKNRGKAYVSSSGKTVSERQIGSGCGVKCRLKCHESFNRDTRQEIFDKFWNIRDVNQQRQFITDHANCKPSKKSRMVYSYSLTMCDRQIRVCKVFFLETLGIKEDTVYGACQKKDSSGIVTHDRRGRHSKHKGLPNHMRSSIRKHVDSFAPVESHYCRKHSQRKYLSESLTLRKMYRMYQEEQKQQSAPAATESAYRKIFNREFNYSFFVPKKDQCDLCAQYKNTKERSDEFEAAYRRHCAEKEMARECKNDAKERKSQSGIWGNCSLL